LFSYGIGHKHRNVRLSALLCICTTSKVQLETFYSITGISVLGDLLECVGLELLDNVPHLLLHQKLNVRHPEYGYTVYSIYMY
jgi:hypothetical protein